MTPHLTAVVAASRLDILVSELGGSILFRNVDGELFLTELSPPPPPPPGEQDLHPKCKRKRQEQWIMGIEAGQAEI